jgi:arginine N-succinyltransferase
VIQQVSRDLNISHSVHALTLCSELTAYSHLSGFYIRNRDSAGTEAALLSRARLLYAVLAPQRFGDRFFVPLAGVTDGEGQSPFWNALGRKFFKMDFLDAERVIDGARNRTLIVELMPHYPVYVPLLPGDAQAALGQIHPSGQLAFKLLTQEGFEADEYIDIFDGGPILQAHKNALRSFCASQVRQVENAGRAAGPESLVTYAVASSEQNFRAVIAACPPLDAGQAICLPREAQQALGVSAGDSVTCVRI